MADDIQLRLRAILALLACAVLWSTGGLFIKLISWDAAAISGWRGVIVVCCLLLVGVRPTFEKSTLTLFGAAATAIPSIGFIFANKMTFAANVMMLQYTAPVYVAVLGWIYLKERPTKLDWAVLFVVFVGMYMFFIDELGVGDFWGNALSIMNAFFIAVHTVILRAIRDYDPRRMFLFAFLIVVACCAPWMLPVEPNARDIGLVLAIGVFQQFIPLLLLSFAIKHVRAIEAPLITAFNPLLAGLWVFIALGELPGRWALVGGSVVLVAVTIYSVATAKTKGRAAPIVID